MSQQTMVFRTRFGWMGLVGTPKGIARIVLPRGSRAAVGAELPGAGARNGGSRNGRRPAGSGYEPPGEARAVEAVLDQARRQLVGFLHGQQRELDFPLDLSWGTSFQRRVWRAAQRIPYGRARSYGWLAARLGGARYARAVGHALGVNPVPIIVPCHRVVGRDGDLTGFAGGLALKRKLLELEGTLAQLKAR